MTIQKRYTCLLLTIYLLLAGCSSLTSSAPLPASSLPEPVAIESTVVVTHAVEYGASLDEWNQVVQDASTSPLVDDAPAEAVPTVEPVPTASALTTTDDGLYTEILWDALIPAGYTADSIMEKYAPQLALIEDGSPAASELYAEMQKEFNNAPVNEEISGTLVKLPGFIAPLEYEGDLITEFLLVPYFGACIHTPAPPVNQTVLVKTAAGQGIKIEDSYAPIWIKGTLTTESAVTTLAESGYYMEEAAVEPYSR